MSVRGPKQPMSAEITHKDLMIATPGKLFAARGWLFELKYDGFRCLASKIGGAVRLLSRNGNDMTARFPEVVESLRAIAADLVVDAELVVCDEMGRPQWDRLHRRHAARSAKTIAARASADPACLFAFDLLWLDGEDYRHFPLSIRKMMLARTVRDCPRVKAAEHFENSPTPLWQMALQLELEGIVAKDASSVYSAGRSTRWQKIKTPAGAERERQRRP